MGGGLLRTIVYYEKTNILINTFEKPTKDVELKLLP